MVVTTYVLYYIVLLSLEFKYKVSFDRFLNFIVS